MVKLKKYNGFLKLFVIFLTLFFIISCSQKNYTLTKIEGKQIPVTENNTQTAEIENFIAPYRNHINKDLDSVLAYCPETLDKSMGKWQTNIGNLLADVCLQRGNLVFKSREKKDIDLCLLNHGGIRAILPKGNVTTRTAFEIMPFENNLVVLSLKGEQILEMTSYIIKEKKPHPLSGMTFTIAKDNTAKNILIQGKPLDSNKIYYVATNDYLANGGDSMNFFLKNTQKFDLNYKLRNVLIDYFKETDTIPIVKDIRITEE
ncbi:5'-nucleotidase C-terminal domain-containing protein [Flavobacterium sp. CF136]|uniref:5'-nucleotidase C-terminal domain-containing protein n=1 Tax=Flavobacterium sp. (strain CF136) TaxID=1144313 RepID=UPI000271B075|nr:5'-nucleotidase [Flavobacterium sp. CF136]EJL63570.1 5'-nucleotidase/2',3'-cyclic phosphodiesterase-like hydrolase [Flavobacterium sp. CF136]